MNKYLVVLFIFCSTTSYAQSVSPDFSKTLDTAKQYRLSALDKEKNIENLISSIKNYNHKNMIAIDKKTLDDSIINLEAQIEKIKKSTGSLFTKAIEKKIKSLNDLTLYKKEYENKQKRMKAIQNTPGSSKRFKNYLKNTIEKKYTKADIAKSILFKKEKNLAIEFEKLNNYIIREKNIYSSKKKEIEDITKNIEASMSFPKTAIHNIDEAMLIKAKEEQKFIAVKNDHKKVQYDVTVSEWESGLFNCKKENDAKLMRYKDFPNLIALTTKGNVRSILNVSAVNPNTKDFVYKCSDFSMFGACKENTKKEICKIQDECSLALEQMENSFDVNKEFKKQKNTYIDHLWNQRVKSISSNESFDILDEWDKEGRLGSISKSEYDKMFIQMREYAMKNSFLSAKDLAKKMKIKIQKQKAKLLKKYKNDEETVRSIDYSHNNMISFFESLQNTDKFQDYVASACTSGEFCSKYQKWLKAASIFDEMEEIENLTEDECPRIVLRFNSSNQIQNRYSCDRPINNIDLKNMNTLKIDSQKILNKIK